MHNGIIDTKEEIKKNGATFTPLKLAKILSEKILRYVDKSEVTVLDPSCGDGALLCAMGQTLQRNNVSFRLKGIDINENYLVGSGHSLKKLFPTEQIELMKSDFLESVNIVESPPTIFSDLDNNNLGLNNVADIVIANPPYVRSQLLGSEYSQAIAKKFSLQGKIDLYFPFLKAMTYSLKEGGIIGVITSNKYLHTKSGQGIRKFLQENYEILEVIDLGDTKLFDAAVLPAIFIGKKVKNPVNNSASFTKIYENFDTGYCEYPYFNDIYEALNKGVIGSVSSNDCKYSITKGKVRFDNSKESNWILLDTKEEEFISKVEGNSETRIKDHFKVRVGIKTTADKVFIHDDWSNLGNDKPEDELIFDLISQENIQAWSVGDQITLQILYPHFIENGKKSTINLDHYPNAKKYLTNYFELLNKRDYLIKSGRQWYEIWVSQNPALWKLPKIVFPDISIEPRFCFDLKGKLVNGNCYWIVAEREEDIEKLLFIQGICNSNLMSKFHSLMYNNKLYSGRKRYFSQFIENYPLPNLNKYEVSQIISIVRMLNSGEQFNRKELIDTLNKLVYDVYSVDYENNI